MTDPIKPCSQLAEIAVLKANQQGIQASLGKLDGKMDTILLELSSIRTLESKQNNHAEALGRAFERIEVIEKQSGETAKSLLEFMSQIRGMTKLAIALWTFLGGAVGWVMSKIMVG